MLYIKAATQPHAPDAEVFAFAGSVLSPIGFRDDALHD
jgi:hypothetical protein